MSLTPILPELFKKPAPPVPWVVKGLVAQGALTVLAGVGGLGKSSFALGLASAVARGEHFYAGFSLEACLPMVYIDGENGFDEMHRRAHAFDIFDGFFQASGNLYDDMLHLAEYLGRGEAPAFVIIDAFRGLFPNVNEDRSEEVLPVLNELMVLARASHCGILLLHHTDKAGYTYRGSGEFQNRPEISVLMREDSRGRFLQWVKVRMGEEPERKYLRLVPSDGRLSWHEGREINTGGQWDPVEFLG